MKRLPACGSTEGLANVPLTQPDAIQRGHSTALLPEDVFLGRAALGLPTDALHDPAWSSGMYGGCRGGWGATPPRWGALLIQEPPALSGVKRGLRGRSGGSGRGGRGQGRAESSWGWNRAAFSPPRFAHQLHTLHAKVTLRLLPR